MRDEVIVIYPAIMDGVEILRSASMGGPVTLGVIERNDCDNPDCGGCGKDFLVQVYSTGGRKEQMDLSKGYWCPIVSEIQNPLQLRL